MCGMFGGGASSEQVQQHLLDFLVGSLGHGDPGPDVLVRPRELVPVAAGKQRDTQLSKRDVVFRFSLFPWGFESVQTDVQSSLVFLHCWCRQQDVVRGQMSVRPAFEMHEAHDTTYILKDLEAAVKGAASGYRPPLEVTRKRLGLAWDFITNGPR